jgi:hypothetical protein
LTGAVRLVTSACSTVVVSTLATPGPRRDRRSIARTT